MAKTKWKVPYLNLGKQFENHKSEFTSAFERVMSDSEFILRDDVKKFEDNMASYLGVRNVIGVNSGTDALYLAMDVLGSYPRNEVITVAHSFVATVASIARIGAKPVLVDICDDFNIDVGKIEETITDRTRAIIPVHLNGRSCNMDEITKLSKKYNLFIIEDAAQAIGSKYKSKKVGSFGTFGCFSTHPMKVLSCAGDGGFISTNDDKFAKQLRILRDHGQKTKTNIKCFGYNSRLDNLQAAILNIKFQHLDEYINRRREIASVYSEELKDLPLVLPPAPSNGDFFDTYNSYVIRSKGRNELVHYLRSVGIEAAVHTAKPLYKNLGLGLGNVKLLHDERICREIISLPINPEMSNKQIDYVVNSLYKFFRRK